MSKFKKSEVSFLQITLFFVIFLFLLVAPFHKALFNGNGLWNGFYTNSFSFETPIYGAMQWISLVLIVVSLFIFVKWKTNEASDLFAIVIWLIPLSYVLASFHAVSGHAHNLSILIHIGYASLFVAALWLARSTRGNLWLISSIIGTGYLIILYGLFNLFGDATFGGLVSYSGDARTYSDSVLIEGRGLRLTSVFQYANAYAAFLLAMIFASLVILVSVKNRWLILLSSFMLVPAFVSLLLTQSRGGIVVLPILFVIVLFFLTVKRQIMSIIHLIVPSILALVILKPINELALDLQEEFKVSLFAQGWGFVIGASLLAMGIAYILQTYVTPQISRLTEKINRRKASNIYIPLLMIILALAGGFVLFGNSNITQALPESLEQRISAIDLQTHSVLERATFYSNAVEIIKDYPVFGAGGGAWAALYETYQTNPYTSRQAHNFFLQYMLETGIVGFVLLAAFFLAITYFFLRDFWRKEEGARLQNLLFFIIALSILVHSAIDFNMSYVYIGALVFLCLGGLVAGLKMDFTIPDRWLNTAFRKIYPSALIVIALVVFVFSTRFAQANNLYQHSISLLQEQKPMNEILVPLEHAIEVQNHPDYLNYYLSLHTQAYMQSQNPDFYQKAEDTLHKLTEIAPFNKIALYQAYNLYSIENQLELALEAVTEGLERFPWEISFYERAMVLHYQIGLNEQEQQANHWTAITQLHEQILEKQAHLDSLPEEQLQGREFGLNKDMALILGEVYENQDQFTEAVAVIEPLLDRSLKEPVDIALARYYLAAKLQSGGEDKELYERIEEQHPELLHQIDQLLN